MYFRKLTMTYILNEKGIVMTILELITAQCGVSGVDKKYAEKIEKISGITEEKDGNIIKAVQNFKDNILPAIQEAENTGKTAITEYEKKHNLKDGKPIEAEDPNPKTKEKETVENTEVAELTKRVEELTKTLTTMADTQKKGITLESVKAKLKGKVDEKFIEKVSAKVNLEAEDLDKEIEAQVKEFEDFKQSLITEYVGDNYVQPNGGASGDKSVEDWAKLMDGSPVADTGVVDLGLGK